MLAFGNWVGETVAVVFGARETKFLCPRQDGEEKWEGVGVLEYFATCNSRKGSEWDQLVGIWVVFGGRKGLDR